MVISPMRMIRALRRESPLLIAREILWRTKREYKRLRLPGRLKRSERITFREVPYYRPDLRNISGRSRALIVAFADEIRAGRYPFLGYGTAELGTSPKWNLDFTTGVEWPQTRHKGHEFIRLDGSDVKVPFELSRLQFLPILGKAYLLTREQSYRRTAMDLLLRWIQSNPVLLGVNWTIAMEAALRAMSICFLLNLLAPFPLKEHRWLKLVTRSLSEHLLYIEANLEFSHLLSSNHYLSNVVGLYCLSLFLDGQGMAARRQEYRMRIHEEMMKQVFDDGADYEASTGYQVLVTQFFTTALLLMRAERGRRVMPAFTERLRMMFRFLNTIASRPGELPHVGDCDDGRVELLVDDLEQMLLFPVAERNSLRISQLLGLGQRLFGEGRGEADDAAWYALEEPRPIPYPAPALDPPKVRPVRLLPKAGIAVLEQQSAELLFFAIPNGIFGKGSHTHNDKLSFVFRVGGKEIFCDSGTGCYTRDIATRNRFRCTAAHNTLLLDGLEQNRVFPGPAGVFILGNEAAVTPILEGEDSQGCFLRASHTGYLSLGVTHTRTIRSDDGKTAFAIEDELEGGGVHHFELNFQLAPNRAAEIVPAKNGLLCRVLGDPQVQLELSGPAGLQGAAEPSLVSTTYGSTVPALRVRIWGRAALPARIITRISWVALANMTGRDSAKESEFRHTVSA
jgi:hypothetical protein